MMFAKNGRTDSILKDKVTSPTIDLLDKVFKGQTIDNRHSSSIFKNRYNQKIMENNIFNKEKKPTLQNKYENYKTAIFKEKSNFNKNA